MTVYATNSRTCLASCTDSAAPPCAAAASSSCVWIIAAVGVIALGSLSGGKTSDAFEAPGVESQTAVDVLQRDFPPPAGASAQLVFATDRGTPVGSGRGGRGRTPRWRTSPASPTSIRSARCRRARRPRYAVRDVQYDVPSDEIRTAAFDRLEGTAAEVKRSDVVRMELGGDLPSEAVQPEFGGQEIVGLIVAAIVLLFAFGSVVAMGLPIVTALFGLGVGIGADHVIASVRRRSARRRADARHDDRPRRRHRLRAVHRHPPPREPAARHDGRGRRPAAPIATAGRPSLFAGITVVIAICGLAIAGIPLVTVDGPRRRGSSSR